MSINYWQHQGTVVPSASGDTPQQPTVVYEGNAQILSGTVFKMWFNNGLTALGSGFGICYAESTNGTSWTRYSSNPVLANYAFARVFKNGSTYYLYGSTNTFPYTSIDVYTSTNGISWTLQKSGTLTVGGSGAWDHYSCGQLNVIGQFGGIWYGYYAGQASVTSPFQMGLATSTDLINWTKGASNPVITNGGPSNFSWNIINGTIYGWSQIVLSGIAAGSSPGLPSDIMRFSATNPSGPFTAFGTPTFYRTQASEGVSSSNGQVGDPCVMNDGTNTWIFFTQSTNGSTGKTYTIGAAMVPNFSLAQLVGTYEGLQNVPIPTALSLNLVTLGSDNFSRANANPIGGNWSQLFTASGWTAAQLLSDKFVSSIAGDNCDSNWNALSWPTDQWVQSEVAACSASSFLVWILRATAGASVNCYRPFWNAGTLGSSASFELEKYLSGTPHNITTQTITINANDIITLVIIGTTLSAYQNGFLLNVATDSSISSGSAGIGLAPEGGNVSNAAYSSWAGGGVTTPILSPASMDLSWMSTRLDSSIRGGRG